MARSLEGKWFHTCYNNGVEAVVSHEVFENIRRKRLILTKLKVKNDLLPHISEVPIFTFVNIGRLEESPWFTGTCSTRDDPNVSDVRLLLNYITRNGGHFGGAMFYVPFSNGAEMGLHGSQSQRDELRYVTTDAQFMEAFGVSLNELRNSGDKYL